MTVKEPTGERGWQTRYINTFCLRGFSAITLPDHILASRSIVIPLVRTPDSHRADADPADYALWPHDRRALVDSLWSMALANLPDLRGYERLYGVLTAHISKSAKDIVKEDELDIELSKLDPLRIGSLMRKLRFEHGSEGGTHKKGWRVSKREVARLALAYGLANRNPSPVNDSQYSNVTNVTDGHKVTDQENHLGSEDAEVSTFERNAFPNLSVFFIKSDVTG